MKITPDLKRFLVEANAMRDARRERFRPTAKRAKRDATSARKEARHEFAHGPDLSTDSEKRLQVVMDSLAGKIKCSGCGAGFFGNEYRTSPGIKVTRYIGYDTPNLMVDLVCLGCNHGGIYKFGGNPLIDEGVDGDDLYAGEGGELKIVLDNQDDLGSPVPGTTETTRKWRSAVCPTPSLGPGR